MIALWDRLVTSLLILAALCFGLAVAVTIADVGVRFLFRSNIHGAIEISTLCVALGAVLSLPMCFSTRSHVTAAMLSEFVGSLPRRLLSALGTVLALAFGGVLFAITFIDARHNFGSPRTLPDTGLPHYVLLVILAAGLALSVVGALRGLLRKPGPGGATHG